MSDIAEILLAQIWNSQWLRQPLRTSDAREVRVVYPGVWTHGFGPDFTGAMIEIDGALTSGDVEVDLAVSGWREHGHDRNDAFDRVVLHLVARDSDEPLVRRLDGGTVPRVVLTDYLRGPLDEFPDATGLRPLGAIGFETCALGPAQDAPSLLREIWERAGDRRMQQRIASISGDLAVQPPAQVLYARLLDAMGFSRNRDPMAEVAARLPFEQLSSLVDWDRSGSRFWEVASLLLGTAGFLPLSPRDAAAGNLEPRQIGIIEGLWRRTGSPWHGIEVSPGFWTLSRSRPASHPVRRLLAMAAILARAPDGLVETLVRLIGGERPRQAINRWIVRENPYLGNAHGHEIVVNVIVPFAIAYGEMANQPDVIDAAAQLWQDLPAGRGNVVTRKTVQQICGESTVSPGSARAEQGLIHINRNGCSQMRCYECPIAHLALEWESTLAGTGDGHAAGSKDPPDDVVAFHDAS